MWNLPTATALLAIVCGCASFQTSSPTRCYSLASCFSIRHDLHLTRTSPRPRGRAGKVFAGSDVGDDSKEEEDCACPEDDGPDILQPYLPAMDPKYILRGPVGEGKFILSRSGPPTAEELSNEQMLQIVKIECSDLEVNTLVWKCLGYRFDEENEVWTPDEVFPKWKEKYPDPPDFIGMKRVYSKEVDQPSLRSNQALVKSIPKDNKQSLKTHLKPIGWKGYQV